MIYKNNNRYIDVSERHLRCIWYDSKLRPDELVSEFDTKITIRNPGRWNFEAGPDFLDAVLIDNKSGKTLKGDIEIHFSPADWISHGHSSNSEYSNVIAHICHYPGRLDNGILPKGCIQISLEKNIGPENFCFEAIDIDSYPYASLSNPPPCRAIISGMNNEDIKSLLDSAGQHRLEQKKDRMRRLIADKDIEQAFYQEIMTALGYKNNKEQFTRLAGIFTHADIRKQSINNPTKAFAIMLGISDMIPLDIPAYTDTATISFVRRLWDIWWKERLAYNEDKMISSDWYLSGIRPLNHPRRRMGAAAVLFTHKTPLLERITELDTKNGKKWIASVIKMLDTAAGIPFLSSHLTLIGRLQPKNYSLIGKERCVAIISNIIIPFAAALGKDIQHIVNNLPGEQDNTAIREAASNILGPDHNHSLYTNDSQKQQGLIQIYQDYCGNKETDCSSCKFRREISSHYQPENKTVGRIINYK